MPQPLYPRKVSGLFYMKWKCLRKKCLFNILVLLTLASFNVTGCCSSGHVVGRYDVIRCLMWPATVLILKTAASRRRSLS